MTPNRMTKIFNKSGGCNEDCLNCQFPDCYKPEITIQKGNEYVREKDDETLTSQQKIYTLELGGYGGASPNLSKKFLY